MMNRLNLIIFLTVILLSIGYGFFKLKTSCYYPTLVTVQIEDGLNDGYQLFYNAGFGINERESVRAGFEKEKGNRLAFEIPGSKFKQLRVDPGESASTIRIREICISHKGIEWCWQGNDLVKYFTPFNQIAEMRVENGDLTVVTNGNDPYFLFIGDLSRFVEFALDWSKVAFLIMKILLFMALVTCVILYYRQISGFISDRISVLQVFKKVHPQRLFVVMASVWGGIMIFLTPPFQVPDEHSHFFRVYQISGLNFMPIEKENGIGGYVPQSVVKLSSNYSHLPFHPEMKTTVKQILNDFNIPLNPEKQEFTYHINSAQYLPVPYFPQALAVSIPRLLHAPPLVIFYMGRLGNLLFWILLVYFAVSITPVHKWVFVLAALLPMTVFQAASLSPDATTIGLSFLFTAYVFYLAYDESIIINSRNVIITLTIALFLAFSKNAYFMLGMLVLLIPSGKFKTKRNRNLFLVYLSTTVLFALILSKAYLDHVIGDLDISKGLYSKFSHFPQNVQPFQQLRIILNNVPEYVSIVFTTLTASGWLLAHQLVGVLGWGDTSLPEGYFYGISFILLIVAITDKNTDIKIRNMHKMLIITVILCVIGTFCTLLYLTWTPVGESLIQGLQGRYFLPVVPLVFTLLYNHTVKIHTDVLKIFVVLAIVLGFFVSSYSLILRYY